ncbi:MAG: bifunctional metallophosphatase/5'-nucleotidase [Prolixibacteraceae bacterium]|nr:bifunctional metallophosphatase/5'-nucleotidase [Prolixibacteraceae bacterium]
MKIEIQYPNTMKIIVNNLSIEIHNGAKVKDAVIRYYSEIKKKLPKSFPVIEDSYGNIVDSDGELSEGNKLLIKEKKKGFFNFTKVLLLAAAITLSVSSCSSVKANAANKDEEKQAVILSVNDMHAVIDNFPKFATLIDSLRNIYPDLLLVAAGDNQTGNPINDRYVEKGLPMIELMNEVGFNLSAVGNHEFDAKIKGFRNLINKAKFDFISSNFIAPDSMGLNIKPYKIITLKNGLNIAFLGLLQLNQNGLPDSHPDNLKGIIFKSPIETAKEYIYLKDKSDIFILLTHYGFEEDIQLAESLPSGTVDLIIGGHSHTRVTKDQVFNNVMITQAGNKLKFATLTTLSLKKDGTLKRESELISITSKRDEKPSIKAMVDKYNDNPEMNTVIAQATDDFSSYDELGYLMADALRSAGDIDITLVNPGGVRIDNLPKGNIRIVDVLRLDPFGNEIVFFKLTGHEIRNLMFAAFPIDDKSPLYVSGIKTIVEKDKNGNLANVTLLTEKGDLLNLDKTYNVAMNSYMSAVYKYDHNDAGQSQFKTSADNMIEYLKKNKVIRSYRGENRISYK